MKGIIKSVFTIISLFIVVFIVGIVFSLIPAFFLGHLGWDKYLRDAIQLSWLIFPTGFKGWFFTIFVINLVLGSIGIKGSNNSK
jgi:hypothetical protein